MNRVFVFLAAVATTTSARANVETNGTQMNGTQMNGTQMNGVSFNGTQMNGTQMNGVQLSGTWLSGSVPCASGQCAIGATQMVGATFVAKTSNGDITLSLNDVRQSANDPELWLYSFTWAHEHILFNPRTGIVRRWYTWDPLCPSTDRDGLYNYALPVAGQWNDCQGKGCGGKTSNDGFALGCTDVGAIAKCVQRFGYKPWKWVRETVRAAGRHVYSHMQTLEPFHEACVRMVRADYCGDGVSHTAATGITEIDVWDYPGVQTQTSGLGFDFEAAWTARGAYCVGGARMSNNPNVPPAFAACPSLVPPVGANPCPLDNGHVAPPGPYPWVATDWFHPAYIANTSSQTLIW
jgi:hypothetical protein